MRLSEAAFRLKMNTLRRSSLRFSEELRHNETLPSEQLTRLQNDRAADIARFAAGETEFYARTFTEHGIRLDQLDDPYEWQRIPLLTRAIAKENENALKSTESNPRTAREAKTGGSTGEPLRTQADNRVPMLSAAWRMYGWWGVQPWDNLARVGRWGFGRAATIKNFVTWWPSRQVYLDAMLFDADSMREFHRHLVRVKPALIEGYVGAMTEFANFLDAENLTIPTPIAIATTAAPLTPNVRARLESVYGAPTYDEYRGSEINWLAGECSEQNGLHQFADLRRIEVVDEEGRAVPPGTMGDIVVTDLTNRVFPLIRYRPGDRGALLDQSCPCGRTLPLMAQPQGRTTDIIRLPGGRILNHGLMAMFAHRPEAVRIFQLHQHADHSITIRVVRGEASDAEAAIETAVEALRRRIDNEVPVTVEYVADLPYTGGKTKYVISDLPA